MKKIFILRIAKFLGNKLTSEGEDQLNHSIGGIKTQIEENDKISIISSCTVGARITSAMVAEGLSVRLFEQYGELWSESGRIGDLDSNRIVLKLEDIDKVIAKKEKDFDVVVMVTHQIYTDLYPKHFFEKKFNMAILYEPLLMGQAFFIDCIEKTIKLVR